MPNANWKNQLTKYSNAAADNGTHQENHEEIGFMETVERNGHEHRPNTVDRRKRSIQKTSAVLVDAWLNNSHVIDDLDNQTEYAAHHENPEQVEEVQLDIAFARLVATEGSVFGTLARLKVGQLALKAALFRKRGIDIRQQATRNAKCSTS